MLRSLATRLLLFMTLWLLVALAITGIYLSSTFKSNAEENFQGLLLAHAYNLMGEIDIDGDGKLIGTPELGDPKFLSPLSGWYWSVSPAIKAERPVLHSASITGEALELPSVTSVPFTDVFRRTYQVTETYGVKVQRLEAQLYLGDAEILYQVLVAGSRGELEQSIDEFNQTLLKFFLVFGLGTIVASYFAVRFGLKPLQATTQSLQNIREGQSENLQGEFPTEIEPLAQEINALIAANRAVTDRARTQVGNLAHALKTPLAVIYNEVSSPTENLRKRVGEQAQAMQMQIDNYLGRARIAAQKGNIVARTEIDPAIKKIVRVMAKLFPENNFSISYETNNIVFKGEVQDLEEVLGNLLENAGRFAKSEIVVKAMIVPDYTVPAFKILVEDDGPGLSQDERNTAMERGKRLDETTPGSGLGLSIVREIANEYDGSFKLGESDSGGLSAVVILPGFVVK